MLYVLYKSRDVRFEVVVVAAFSLASNYSEWKVRKALNLIHILALHIKFACLQKSIYALGGWAKISDSALFLCM